MTATPKRSLWPWIVVGVCVAVVLACGGVLWYAVVLAMRTFASERDRELCERQLDQLSVALEAYDTQNNGYPPAVTKDAAGKPMHSWRALLLPHLGEDLTEQHAKQEALAKLYDLKQPWDSVGNAKLAPRMPRMLSCPCDPAGWEHQTSYIGVVDPTTGQLGYLPQGWVSASVPAGAKIVVIELHESGVMWLEPRDLVPGTPEAGKILDAAHTAGHYGGTHILLDDGSVHLLKGAELDTLLEALR